MDLRNCIYQKINFIEQDYFEIMFDYIKSLSSYSQAEIVRDGGLIDTNIRSTKIAELSPFSLSLTNVHWFNYLKSQIMKEVINYKNTTTIWTELKGEMDMAILKYNPGDFYVYHVDDGHRTPRTLSIIILLNDDYKGGELCFLSPDKKQETIIKTEKNKLIMWPINFLYPHSVKKVTEGVRHSIVSWIR